MPTFVLLSLDGNYFLSNMAGEGQLLIQMQIELHQFVNHELSDKHLDLQANGFRSLNHILTDGNTNS